MENFIFCEVNMQQKRNVIRFIPKYHRLVFFMSNLKVHKNVVNICPRFQSGSRTAATFKMERFVIIVNGFQPLTIITKRSILDVAAVLDPPLGFA